MVIGIDGTSYRGLHSIQNVAQIFFNLVSFLVHTLCFLEYRVGVNSVFIRPCSDVGKSLSLAIYGRVVRVPN